MAPSQSSAVRSEPWIPQAAKIAAAAVNAAGGVDGRPIQTGLTNVTWAFSSFEITPQLVQLVSKLKIPNIAVLGLGGDSTEQAFQADVAKYGPNVGGITDTISESSLNAWLAVKLLPDVVKGAGSLDAATIMAWLDKQTAFVTMGATPPINFTKSPIPTIPRLVCRAPRARSRTASSPR